MGWAQNSAGLGMFGSPRSPAAPWYGYSHDLDADEPSPRASRSHTHSPAGDPTLELEIATSFNTVLNKMRRLEADLGRPLRSPKHSPGKSQSPTSDARMKRMEKMERRLTWVLENGAAQPGVVGGGASESDPAEPAASPARPPAGDEPMPEASRTLARRELERLTTERDEALAALAAERAARERSERADAYARLLAENRRLANENAELRAAMMDFMNFARNATGASPAAQRREEEDAHEMRRLKDELDASTARANRRPGQTSVSDASDATGECDRGVPHEALVSLKTYWKPVANLMDALDPSRTMTTTTMDGVPASPSRVGDDVQAEPKRIVAG